MSLYDDTMSNRMAWTDQKSRSDLEMAIVDLEDFVFVMCLEDPEDLRPFRVLSALPKKEDKLSVKRCPSIDLS